jgi:hypothetical protein
LVVIGGHLYTVQYSGEVVELVGGEIATARPG